MIRNFSIRDVLWFITVLATLLAWVMNSISSSHTITSLVQQNEALSWRSEAITSLLQSCGYKVTYAESLPGGRRIVVERPDDRGKWILEESDDEGRITVLK
jgi:hypothetical protein